jgi:flagellar P-ring protein precursor FlgI
MVALLVEYEAMFLKSKYCYFLNNISRKIICLFVVLMTISAISVQADRIKDLATIEGVRSNQLIGYGLVVGLSGTGDNAPFTNQTFRNLMNKFGITLPSGVDPKLKNVAAVSITANLPAFAKPGQKLDVTVSSIGNAKSLRGGSLLMAPLKGADGRVYAISQGNLVVGGFGVDGADGSSIKVNIPSVGRIDNGATVERSVPSSFQRGDSLVLNLNDSDFTTAKNVVDKINSLLGPGTAYAEDSTSIRVKAPRDASQRVSFLSIIQGIDVKPGIDPARVVINSRTGTIVIGQNVRVLPAAVTHGSLSVTIKANNAVSQPSPLSTGSTVVVPQTTVSAKQGSSHMFKFGPAATLNEIVQAVNQVGAAPGDIMAILEALKEAGALKAELIVI